ncbi:MAG: glycosyltransferase, partial [Proteobacteria bacterium]|nr:glycosyltransferase [Pseudomonadota bacterium]
MRILVVDNGLGPFVDEQVESIRETDPSIDIIRYSFSGKNNKFNYLKAIFKINKIIQENNIDIIHAHYGLTGFISLFQNKCPMICTFHGSDVLYVKWQSLISRFVARHCAVSIAVSKKIAKILNTKNTYVIPCGVDREFFRP